MGILGSWPGGAAAGVPPSGAGYAALLATARAGASEGDWYEDSQTGAAFRYYAPSGSQGVLVPASVYDSLNGYVTNASGIAEWTLADDEDTDNDLTNRGWVINLGTGSTFTKVGGSAASLDSGTNANQSSNPVFAPTGNSPTKSLIICRLSLVNVNNNNSGGPFYVTAQGGAYYGRWEHNTSAEDGRGRWWSGSAQSGGGIITQGVGNVRTLFFTVDSSTADGSWTVTCLETGEVVSAQRSQLLTTTSSVISWQCSNISGGGAAGRTQHDIYELHWIALA